MFSEQIFFYPNENKISVIKDNDYIDLRRYFRLLGAYFSLSLAGKCTLEMDPLREFIHLCLAKTKHVFPRFSQRSRPLRWLIKDILCSLGNKPTQTAKLPITFYNLFLDKITSKYLCIYTSWEQDYNSSAFKEKSKWMMFLASIPMRSQSAASDEDSSKHAPYLLNTSYSRELLFCDGYF